MLDDQELNGMSFESFYNLVDKKNLPNFIYYLVKRYLSEYNDTQTITDLFNILLNNNYEK